MIHKIRALAIVLSVVMLGLFIYQYQFRDTSRGWKNYQKPQVAAYASLEQDQEILKELQRQTQFSTYKNLDPGFFVKPNIFNTIERR